MRAWVRDRPADRPRPHHRRHHRRHPVAERAGRGRAHRRAADLQRPAAAAQHPDQGPADLGRGIREHRHPHQSRRLGAAPWRRRAARARRRQSRPRHALQRRRRRRRSRSISRPAPTPSTRSNAVRESSPRRRSVSRTISNWKVTYDPTIFVTDTIHEVQKTLVEAFILVVLVVFLFLGSLRATLIPTLAVPVSLIGTFIVLNAVGYSANTVSLLAIVLAIGIVVDDAIVVVENVERVMEEHPELSPAEATKRAMARDHRADHRHHAGAALGLRAGRLHPRHFRRIVPPVRGDRRGVDVPLGDQRADACRRRCAACC